MKNKNLILGAGILAIVVIGIFLISNNSGNASSLTGNTILTGKNSNTKQEIIEDSESIKIPLSQISDKAKWYTYEYQGTKIRYFVVEDVNGNVKTAFDACDVCYRSKKGYSQRGIDMVCNNCGNHYPIAGLGTKNLRGGGCWPGYLPSEVQEDYLVIKKSDLQQGEYRFKWSMLRGFSLHL